VIKNDAGNTLGGLGPPLFAISFYFLTQSRAGSRHFSWRLFWGYKPAGNGLN